MSKPFWVITTCLFAAFGGYQAALNLFLRELHTTAVKACVAAPVPRESHIQARGHEL